MTAVAPAPRAELYKYSPLTLERPIVTCCCGLFEYTRFHEYSDRVYKESSKDRSYTQLDDNLTSEERRISTGNFEAYLNKELTAGGLKSINGHDILHFLDIECPETTLDIKRINEVAEQVIKIKYYYHEDEISEDEYFFHIKIGSPFFLSSNPDFRAQYLRYPREVLAGIIQSRSARAPAIPGENSNDVSSVYFLGEYVIDGNDDHIPFDVTGPISETGELRGLGLQAPII